MDKWENPIPILMMMDAVILAVVFFLGKWAFRQIG